MSSRRNSGAHRRRRRGIAVGALLLLAAVLAPLPASAVDLKLWPLVDASTSDRRSHLSLLGPLVEWSRDEGETSFTLRPLFHTARKAGTESRRSALLYPLLAWDTKPGRFFLRFFGLVSYEWKREDETAAAASPERRFTIFPFVFYRASEERGASLSVLPFYANLEGFFGYERVRMFLFPLYLKLVEPTVERTWLPFPFWSSVGGTLGSGRRLWPVYGWTRIGSRSETTYRGWPFYVRHVEHPGTAGEVVTRVSWPFFTLLDGPNVESRSYAFLLVLPLWTRSIDRRRETETIGFPWPFWSVHRSTKTGEVLSRRFAPFWQDRRSASLRSVFFLWPLYRERTGLGDSAGYFRRDVLFVLYRDQQDGDGPRAHRTRALLPLWLERDGSVRSLTLLDGVFPSNEMLARVYAPLYRIYGREPTAEGTRRDVLWRMIEWGDGKLRPPWYVSLD